MDMVDEHECFAHHDLFEKEVDSKEPEYECLECGDSGRSHPTLANPDGEVCKCVKDDIVEPEQAKPEELPEVSGDDYASKPTKIKLGDFVQVNRDYRNLFGDELIPGGIYRVRKVFSNVSIRLSDTLEKSYIAPNYVRKIDFKIGTRVRTIGAVTPPGLNESEKVSGSGVVTNISSIKNGEKFSCVIHFDEIDDLWWLSEGQFTLDE